MEETPMLSASRFVDGAVDYNHRPALRSNSGLWRSAAFIIVVEIAERFAYMGISANLITFLTGPLGQSTAAAAVNVNVWNGTAMLLPLLGAFVADSFLGRYRTIVAASLLYILGMGLLTLSALLLSLVNSQCRISNAVPCTPSLFQVILFFFSLYLIAIAQGGHKPCTQAFGADQFDGQDPMESKAKSSFFNWWYFGVCTGVLITTFTVTYIQDNLSWALGFGIPCIVMVVALVVFLLGTTTYRYTVSENENGPFSRISRVFVAAIRNRNRRAITSSTKVAEEESCRFVAPQSYEQFRCLNKALIEANEFEKHGRVCSVSEVEEAKAVVRLIPIWTACLTYGIVSAQSMTFFTKQGATVERTISSGFEIPAASLQCFSSLVILIFLPVYDRVLVPIARASTGNPSGITMLQRIGSGLFVSALSMVIAALVETKRLSTAQEYGLVDDSITTVPMSVWWLVPQYILSGIGDALTLVGLQEFFYDEVPIELRSAGLAMYLSIAGVGSFLSSFLVSVIDKATREHGRESWFSNNLNQAHLDYFYWLLAALSALALSSFVYFSRLYVYNKRT